MSSSSDPGGGTRADNITGDQASPREGVDTLAEDDSAMTPRDTPDGGEDGDEGSGQRPYRDEEE